MQHPFFSDRGLDLAQTGAREVVAHLRQVVIDGRRLVGQIALAIALRALPPSKYGRSLPGARPPGKSLSADVQEAALRDAFKAYPVVVKRHPEQTPWRHEELTPLFQAVTLPVSCDAVGFCRSPLRLFARSQRLPPRGSCPTAWCN